MDRLTPLAFALATTTLATASAPLVAQEAAAWDQARAQMVAQAPTRMSQAVERWEYLSSPDRRAESFDTYAGFVLAYPGFPREELLRTRAENALADEPVGAERLVAFFDRFPPLTNPARARYAIALASANRPEAFEVARAAWRGGKMSSPSEAYLLGLFSGRFTQEDNDARMNALLWQGEGEAAVRLVNNVSPAIRDTAFARLSLVRGTLPQSAGTPIPANAQTDPGYVYNLARHYRTSGQAGAAVDLLANRPQFARPAHDPEAFVTLMLQAARSAGASQAVRIASKTDDLFAPGTDISKMSFRLRDDYTSLMWLGGTQALWTNGDARSAAPLFYRYGTAAQTPQTRSKGFYWAGKAAERAGDRAEAQRYYGLAGQYPDRFYGQLALAKLGRQPVIPPANASATPSAEQRAAFANAPLTNAVREVARGAPWRTGIHFYREIAQQAVTPEEHVLVAELARETGRRDLAVNLADAAGADGLDGFIVQGYPTLPTPQGTDWTMVHAIARQESQFAQNAISHAGARGLMQLMPPTAREEAGKAGMTYLEASLINDAGYNVQLGSNHIQRLIARYNGSYPLAIAAYNAGPGRVNQWLRENGDPRTGSIDWETWIERIGITETRTYVHRVLENAAVYEQLNPDKAPYGRPRQVRDFLR
jgi:soluble lytic murein transglycosylase